MEWWETQELRAMVQDEMQSSETRQLISEFQNQLDEAIEQAYITPEQFLEITGDDCESMGEVVFKLHKIRDEVFK